MTAKPSQELLRSLSDEHVLRALMSARKLTRAELAVETGLSKPTVGESVRRLVEQGLVADTGERTPGGRGKGRVGSFYSLASDVGVALVVTIAPAGVTAECVDAYGDVVTTEHHAIASPAEVAGVLPAVVAETVAAQNVRLCTVSAADPVDRRTGRLVQLPDSPFLVGSLDPVAVLRPLLNGPVIVDNDVNWAAQAEHAVLGVADFAYLYLGEGLGCAVVSDGEVRRGHAGLSGEISHLITAGPSGAMAFIEVFGALGLRQAGSTAIDVDRLLAADSPTLEVVARAVSGVITALVALADPAVVVVGGPWGPALLDAISSAPRPVSVVAASVAEPSLTGARAEALDRLRTALVEASRNS
ncbi:ROK family transcriptional regulator [Lentzea sp. BCCO 10_0856]|uniref:ROK family transcriptional regulator n=1 Tax=Lentzea miocenica TaxID=3095431 RepID=A0ABU4SW97_9PSEU|nr:ROK family transcriptional regulator [Lentzea sp. BCCO 10_0856]MDX8030198.1 ROK family transcriptional regulator [Lentzea sp. BCCO 10_0856]